jgi:hypothetical protein
VPDDFGNLERVRRGAGNYDAMCINCHLAPEMPDSEIRKGLYPRPPNLVTQAQMPELSRIPHVTSGSSSMASKRRECRLGRKAAWMTRRSGIWPRSCRNCRG